jgi:hypothetical protein
MGKVRLRRQQERDRRSGRTWTINAENGPAVPGPEPAQGYAALTAHLEQLRTALAADRFTTRASIQVQHDQAALERLLGEAVTRCFAADAHGSPVPDGISSWVGEGLARSDERERLMLGSIAMPAARPGPADLPFSRPAQ